MRDDSTRAWARGRALIVPVATIALVVAAFVRLVAPQYDSATLLLTSLTQWAFLPAYPVAVVAGFTRRWVWLAVSLVVVVAHVAWVSPEVFDTTPIPRGPAVRVATANLYAFNGHRGDIPAALIKTHADVLVLEELIPAQVQIFERQGLFARYPYRFLRDEQNPQGIGIVSRLPFTDPTLVPIASARALHITIRVGGHPVDVWAVHTHAPRRGEGRGLWDAEFRALRTSIHPSRATIVAGDFNATMQFPSLLAFAHGAHLTEAHRARGQGLASTWPANKPFPPLVRVDHVFVHELGVRGVGTFHVPGSDHRGVVADIVVPMR